MFMPRTERIMSTVGLVMLGLALSILIPLPAFDFTIVLGTFQFPVHFSGTAQFMIVTLVLLCAGMDSVMRTYPQVRGRSIVHTAPFWVLPSLLTLTSVLLLVDLVWWGYWIIIIMLTGLILSVVIVFQGQSISPLDGGRRVARLGLNVATYFTALVFYALVYELGLRSVLFGAGVCLASGALALELLRDAEVHVARIWLYAGLCGASMGELAWAISYWGLDARIGGAMLLLA
ncbi:MAG: hypothetical protein A2Y73_01355, partial [Chloroflexi bacterium RBG_13_56_8]